MNSVNNSLCLKILGKKIILVEFIYIVKMFTETVIEVLSIIKNVIYQIKIFPKIISKFKDSKKIKNNIWFISEMQFHDEVIYKFIEPYDEIKILYQILMKFILNQLKEL